MSRRRLYGGRLSVEDMSDYEESIVDFTVIKPLIWFLSDTLSYRGINLLFKTPHNAMRQSILVLMRDISFDGASLLVSRTHLRCLRWPVGVMVLLDLNIHSASIEGRMRISSFHGQFS